MNFAVRAAKSRDLDDLIRLARQFADQTKHEFTANSDTVRASLFGPVAKAYALIAQDTTPEARTTWRGAPGEAHTVGFALWHYDFDLLAGLPGIYLEDLHVDPACRGQGISLAFFATLARRAIGEGCGRMRWSGIVGRAPGLNLYRSLSAIPVAAWTSQTLTGDALKALAG